MTKMRLILKNRIFNNIGSHPGLSSTRKFQFFSIGNDAGVNKEKKGFTPDIGPMVPGRPRSKPLKVQCNITD